MSLTALVSGCVAVFVVFAVPIFVHAGIISFLSSLFGSQAGEQVQSTQNSQTVPLLEAPANSDPVLLAKGGGDISIVNGTALLSESGPNGSMADVGTSANQHGNISVYIVREGDTLSQIAKMFGVTTNTIAWQNDIRGGLIREGQALIILPVTGVQHVVKKGDTVASIAKQYKADVEDIVNYNDISESDVLAVGAVIMVPDGEPALLPSTTSTYTYSVLRGTGGPEYAGYYLRPIIGGRKTQGLHGYNAVDLASFNGAAVMASANGQVIIARVGGWNGGYGSYIVISHPNGTQTLYAHLSQIIVYVGQQVIQGQVVGGVGTTGRSTGPHLHFEIRGAKNPF